MTDTKKKNMTEAGFLHKSSGKVSAVAFLAQHREWLLSGSMAQFTDPILAKLDRGEILPTPALSQIREAVLAHKLARDVKEAEAKMAKQATPSDKPRKLYLVTIRDSNGMVVTRKNEKDEDVDLIQDFEGYSQAEGWADRRMFDGASDWVATIENTATGFTKVIPRDECFLRIIRSGKKPVMAKGAPKSAPLTSKMKVSGSHFHFSRG
jgi:hypothetical protein